MEWEKVMTASNTGDEQEGKDANMGVEGSNSNGHGKLKAVRRCQDRHLRSVGVVKGIIGTETAPHRKDKARTVHNVQQAKIVEDMGSRMLRIYVALDNKQA
jgi:hypothetical protein